MLRSSKTVDSVFYNSFISVQNYAFISSKLGRINMIFDTGHVTTIRSRIALAKPNSDVASYLKSKSRKKNTK